MHLRGHSSAAKRGLKADAFIIMACTRNRRLAEMWEAWLYAVYKPPFNKRRPRVPPRRPPVFPGERRRNESVEEPVAATRCAEVISLSPPGVSAYATPASIGDGFVNGTALEASVDKPPPAGLGIDM